jgi:hypothetical protein
MPDPVVFISSTFEDLKEHREQAERAAKAAGFSPRMMEYFPASGDKLSLPKCLEMVDQAEVVAVTPASSGSTSARKASPCSDGDSSPGKRGWPTPTSSA